MERIKADGDSARLFPCFLFKRIASIFGSTLDCRLCKDLKGSTEKKSKQKARQQAPLNLDLANF